MNLFHCKVRRRTYSTLVLAVIFALASLIFVQARSRAEAQNPIKVNKAAPELVGSQWVNTPNGAPLKLADRKGKVTLLHFWTFGCINCKHNLPGYARLQKQFAAKDVAIIGVHTPETPEEARAANVRARIKEYGITYPILVDDKHTNWNRWNQEFWPTVYLLDKTGRIRYRWEGELEYNGQNGTLKVAALIEKLLKEN